jgi:hypothetical protein|tara:strand:+ start:4433 stop:4768 length:336 start_codon:yes stop_codon:yes gene_type:complete
MINNFDDFDSGRMDDLSFDRNAHMNEPAKKDRSDDKPFILLSELRDALIGVIEGADTHPRACYSINMVKTILQEKHDLPEDVLQEAVNTLMRTYLGPSTPCFLDTSILSDE